MPTTHVLDIRGKKGAAPILVAPQLIEAIAKRLERQEQSIIFLNRRGYASSLQCPQCGHVEMCPNCSVALTFHRRAERLRCHLCDYASAVPHACPHCGFAPYKYAGSGTEKVEQALVDAFPQGADRADGFRQHARARRLCADARRLRGREDRPARRYADDREGPPLSEGDLRRRDQRRSRPADSRFPGERAGLPTADAGRRPQRARGPGGRGLRADAGAVSPRRSSSRGTTTTPALPSRNSSSGAASTTRPTSGSSWSRRAGAARRRPSSLRSSWRRSW